MVARCILAIGLLAMSPLAANAQPPSSAGQVDILMGVDFNYRDI